MEIVVIMNDVWVHIFLKWNKKLQVFSITKFLLEFHCVMQQ